MLKEPHQFGSFFFTPADHSQWAQLIKCRRKFLIFFYLFSGNPEDAAKFYKRGIAELEKGIAVDCSAGRGEVWDKARKLSDKMKTNLAMAKDRLNYLGEDHSNFFWKLFILRTVFSVQTNSADG